MPLVTPAESDAPIWLRKRPVDNDELRILERTVGTARRLARARRVSLLLPASNSTALAIAAASGMDARMAARVRVELGKPVAGAVALKRRPILSNDCAIRPHRGSRRYRTGAFICVPVPLGDNACGVLNVADPLGPEGFQPADVQALEELVQDVARDLHLQHVTHRAGELEQAVQQLRRHVIEVQEAERQRIARDLHDEAGQALTTAVLGLDLEMMQLTSGPGLEALQRVRQQLVECSNKLHAIAFDLRPRILEDLGLHAALRSVASQILHASDLELEFTVEGNAWALEQIEELVLLRIVQEALMNVRKHAQASYVKVALRYGVSGITLQIADDGVGLHRPRARVSSALDERVSLGIDGMRERVEQVGGNFCIRRGRTGGTCVTAHLPR